MERLIVFDVDNTLLTSHEIYDEAYLRTSRELLGREFSMTTNPDGSPDRAFSKMNNLQIFLRRLEQLGLSDAPVGLEQFFERFEEHAVDAAATLPFALFEGVGDFLNDMSRDARLTILSGGPERLQRTILQHAGVLQYFDMANARFLFNVLDKGAALSEMVEELGPEILIHVGDAPSDMQAVKVLQKPEQRMAIGVTIVGLTTNDELQAAGADLVLGSYVGATPRVRALLESPS